MRASAFRRGVLAYVGIAMAGAALAALPPTAAFAANTASFSSAAPKSGSYTMATTPKVSVTVYDKYGAKISSSTGLFIDGHRVAATCSYIVSGAWNPRKPDYRRFKLSFQVPSSLAVGTHTVTVKIKDLKKKSSTYTWRFNVDAASDPATFSALTPADGSSTQIAKPKISVAVASRWDVKGSGCFSLKLDGTAVGATCVYATSGVYRDFRVSYQPGSALGVGQHSVTLSVLDAAKRTTSTTWTFTVLPPDPVYDEMPVNGAACTDCHAGYPASHPMTDCAGCHDAGSPPRPTGSIYAGTPMIPMGPGDASAHTAACAQNCHGERWTGAYPHVLDRTCTRCHNASFPEIPPTHDVDAIAIRNLHTSTPTFCTAKFCHASTLTAEHYRLRDGSRLGCSTCHASKDTLVVAAIDQGLTTCQSCHPLGTFTHPNTAVAHTAVGGCVRAGCHSPDVAVTHKQNCDACHSGDTLPSVNCSGCHAAGAYHAGEAAAHRLSVGTCVQAAPCHGVDFGMDAALTHKGNAGCPDCHNDPKGPSLNCTGCHTEGIVAVHQEADAAHTPASTFCTTPDCHGSNVAATHFKDGVAKCAACHAKNAVASVTCDKCHSGDILEVHKGAADAHRIVGGTCIATGCHTVTDAAAIHDTDEAGCGVCHERSGGPILTCTTCHAGSLWVVHSKVGTGHISTNTTCIGSKCHTADVTVDHTLCSACHGRSAALSAQCTDCHKLGLVPTHASADTSHSPGPGFCQTTCHDKDNVAQIHEEAPRNPGCVSCHNDHRSPSVRCADCHTGTLNQQHSRAVAGHVSTYAGGCLLPGCHSSDVVTVHAKLEGDGCWACHDGNRTASTVCSACHAGDVTTLHKDADAKHAVPSGYDCFGGPCHASNVGTIHAGSTLGCAACHDGVKTLIVDCATCHPGGADYLHRDGDSKHVSVASGCVSAKCHSTDASVAHQGAGGPSCLACHAPAVTPSATCTRSGCHPGDLTSRHTSLTVAGTRVSTSHASPAGTCVKTGCHGADTGVDVAALHASGSGCIDCHAAGVTASTTCTACHSADLPTVHTRGNAYHTAPASSCYNSGAVSCHGRDVIAIHAVEGGPGCYACHKPGQTPYSRCDACHTGAFWGGIHTVTTEHTPVRPVAGGCVTTACHSTDVASIHSSSAPTNGPGCAPCHRQGTLTLDCTTCHSSDITPRHAAQNVEHTAAAGLCVNAGCHGADSGVNVATLHWTAKDGCGTCHAQGDVPAKTCTTCHDDDPLDFHNSVGGKHRVAAGTCVEDGCHGDGSGADVVALHAAGPGCTACHAPGKTASTDCAAAGCHSGTVYTEHQKYLATAGVNKHVAPPSSCNSPLCHTSLNVSTLHGSTNCTPCHGEHASPAATVTCSTVGCHSEGYPAVHGTVTAHAIVSQGTCVSSHCHHQAVDALHAGAGGPSCLACHSSGAGPAATASCAACHSGANAPGPSSGTPHPTATAADTQHTVAATGCSRPTCHSTNLAAIHATPTTGHPTPAQCVACHGDNAVASKACSACHVADFAAPHPAPAADHTAPLTSCTASACHGTNIALIHAAPTTNHPEPVGCDACHAVGVVAGTDCADPDCHGGGFPATHPAPVVAHTTPDACASECHRHDGTANVATLHAGSDLSCRACHDTDRVPSLTCVGCHPVGVYHGDAATKHAVSGGCVSGACHQADVSAIHGRTGCGACHKDGATPSTTCVDCHPGITLASHVDVHADCIVCHNKLRTWHPLYQYIPRITATSDCSPCHTGGIGGQTSLKTERFQHNYVRFNGQPDYLCYLNCHGNQDVQYWIDSWIHGPFDKIAPTTVATSDHLASGGARVVLSATDTGEYNPLGSGVAHTYYKVDGGDWIQGTEVTIDPPVSGTAGHHVYYYSDDLCLNREIEHDLAVNVAAP